MSTPPPELPNTHLTRRWLTTLREATERDRTRQFRRRRTLAALTIGVVIAAVGVAVLSDHGSGRARVAPTLPAFVPDASRRALAPAFEAAARESKIAVTLLMALTWRESQWNENLVSGAGAVGIGQLLPPTSMFVAQALLHDPRLDPRRPVDNIRLTARYLRELIDTFHGNERLGVGAYLQGSTSVTNQGLTPQTTDYVHDIAVLRTQFARARHGR